VCDDATAVADELQAGATDRRRAARRTVDFADEMPPRRAAH